MPKIPVRLQRDFLDSQFAQASKDFRIGMLLDGILMTGLEILVDGPGDTSSRVILYSCYYMVFYTWTFLLRKNLKKLPARMEWMAGLCRLILLGVLMALNSLGISMATENVLYLFVYLFFRFAMGIVIKFYSARIILGFAEERLCLGKDHLDRLEELMDQTQGGR